MIEGKEGDWVFVDWANIDNRGEVAAEQIIYLKALETMQKLWRDLWRRIPKNTARNTRP